MAAPAKGYVLAISGGQDSALTGRLCQLACEELRAERREATFMAVRLPYGVQADEDDAQIALQFIQPDHSITVNIGPGADAVAAETALGLRQLLGAEPGLRDFVRGNIKARERMVVQYAIAGQLNLLVVGTDHAAEALTGFFTKYGDGGAGITPADRTNQAPARSPASRAEGSSEHLGEGSDRRPGGRSARPARRGRAGTDLLPDR